MSENSHALLDECIAKAKSLGDEIDKFKSAVALNESLANSLQSVNEAITSVAKEVKPIITAKFRRFQQLVIGLCSLTLLISIVTLVLVLTK